MKLYQKTKIRKKSTGLQDYKTTSFFRNGVFHKKIVKIRAI